MGYFIPDDELKLAGVSEGDARIELACRLFDIGKLSLFHARKVAGLSERCEMEEELRKRDIPIHRPTIEDFEHDMKTLDRVLGPVNRVDCRQ